jgi:hypothetical protein
MKELRCAWQTYWLRVDLPCPGAPRTRVKAVGPRNKYAAAPPTAVGAWACRCLLAGSLDSIGGDVDEEVHDLLTVYIGLAELDPLVVFPLRRGDLADQVAMRVVFAGADLLRDEVPDEIPSCEHVGVRPLDLDRGVVDPRIQRFAPDAGHLLVAEVPRIPVELVAQPVERARIRLRRATQVGDQEVAADTLCGQTPKTRLSERTTWSSQLTGSFSLPLSDHLT